MTSHFTKLARYQAWADRRVLEALVAHPEAQDEALPLLAHILAAEHMWLCRILSTEPRIPVWPQLLLTDCASWVSEIESSYRTCIEALTEQELSRIVRYRNTQGHEYQTAVADILLQVFTHGGYHRGQIARVIGRAGGIAINTDYITFTRES